MIFIAVCDDKPLFSENIRQIIEKYIQIRNYDAQIDIYNSGLDLLNKIKEINYDLILLDIDMPDINGIDTALKIRQISKDVSIAFITAFINYALEGYKVHAIRYILKDKKKIKNSVYECLDTFIQEHEYREYKLELPFREGTKEISIGNIIYIESRLHMLIFNVFNSGSICQYTISRKLDEIEKLLSNYRFVRVHKSYLVNLRYVVDIKRYEIVLHNDEKLPVAQSRYIEVRDIVMDYLGDI